MSFFEELSTTVKATLYERVSSPFLGSFLFTWFAFNWKAVSILVFEDASMWNRIVVIEANYVNLYDNLIWPVVYAAIFAVVYPMISIGFYYIWEFSNSQKVTFKRKREMAAPLDQEKVAAFWKEYLEKKRELESVLSDKDEEVNRLKGVIEKYQEELESKKKEEIQTPAESEEKAEKAPERMSDLSGNRLSTLELNYLNEIYHAGGLSFPMVKETLGITGLEAEVIMSDLRDKGLVEMTANVDSEGERYFIASSTGKKALLKNSI